MLDVSKDYSSGDYGFDPLRLMPKNKADRYYYYNAHRIYVTGLCANHYRLIFERRFMIEAELNHCRLAMVAAIGPVSYTHLTLPTIYSV